MTDLQPHLEEVLQAELAPELEHLPATPVVVRGTVRIQSLPEKAGTTKTVAVPADGRAHMIAGGNHRRSRTMLIAIGGNMRVAFNKASKEDPSTMALWPATVPFVHLGDDEIWVLADTVPITVSFIAGRWAVGEDGSH